MDLPFASAGNEGFGMDEFGQGRSVSVVDIARLKMREDSGDSKSNYLQTGSVASPRQTKMRTTESNSTLWSQPRADPAGVYL